MTVRINQRIRRFEVVDESLQRPAADAPGSPPVQMDETLQRPEMLIGVTYKIKSPLFEHALYVTINDILLNAGTPYEQRRPLRSSSTRRTWTISSGSSPSPASCPRCSARAATAPSSSRS